MLLLLYILFLGKIYVSLTPAELENFKGIFIIAGTVSLLSFPLLPVNGIFTAYERLYAQKLFDLLAKIITVSAVVIALLLGGSLFTVVFFNTSITFLVNLIKFLYIKRKEKIKIQITYRDKAMLKSIFGFSIWVMIASIADRFFFTFIPSLLGIISNTVEISIFAVAVSVENYICLFGSAFNNLYLPQVTRMVIAKEDKKKITDLMIKVGRIQLIIVSLFVVALVSMGKEFVICWVGEKYIRSYYVMILILVPSLVHFSQAIGTEMIYATNNVKYRALVYSLGSVISIITTLTLGKSFGAIGAAVGISLALILSHIILMNYIYYKKLGLDVMRYFKECHFKMYIPLLISCGIGFVISSIYPTTSLRLFIVKGAIWGVIHCVILWLFVLNSSEKALVKGFIYKLKKGAKKNG